MQGQDKLALFPEHLRPRTETSLGKICKRIWQILTRIGRSGLPILRCRLALEHRALPLLDGSNFQSLGMKTCFSSVPSDTSVRTLVPISFISIP